MGVNSNSLTKLSCLRYFLFIQGRYKRAIGYIDVVEQILEQEVAAQGSTDVPVSSEWPFMSRITNFIRTVSLGNLLFYRQ